LNALANRVLVVEDEEMIRDSVIEFLDDQGFEAFGASDGKEALDKLTNGEQLPCLILLDLMMPIMDGRAFREKQLQNPALAEIPVRRALIARAEEARDVLPDGLRARGVEVDILPLYRTVAEPLGDEARAAALGADYATFTSASSARFLHAAAGTLSGPRLVSIGPATSAAMRELGFEPDVEAADHTPDGLVAALLADASGTVAG